MSDLRSPWQNVARRMQAEASKQNGAAIMQITIMVDENNNPSFWTEPVLVKLEPKANAQHILRLLVQLNMPQPA